MKGWSKRFLESTRGRVVQLLRGREATVNDLAGSLALTDNAVRSHLATLERDGLVQETGKRPGVRKPEVVYALTPEAEQLFPKAYHLLLNQLLRVLAGRLPPARMEELLREVGRGLAADQTSSLEGKGLRERVERAQELLRSIGGLAELEEADGRFVLRGCSCPFADSVRENPGVCLLAEALLAEIVGVPVQETCERSGTPRCVFLIQAEG